jgi:hypothetical protein
MTNAQNQLAALIRGVRVEGDSVVVSMRDNDRARQLCGELVALSSKASAPELARQTFIENWAPPLSHGARPKFDREFAALAIEPIGWRAALQFYADRSHFAITDESAWDTVSGEPANFWCDEAGTATVEDGTVAAMALAGTPLPDEDDAAPLAAPGDATGGAL